MNSWNRSMSIEEIVNEYSDMIYRIAYTSLKSFADAEDIVQTVLIKYLEQTKPFDTPEHQKAWLIRVTINECKNYYRSSWIKKIVPLHEWNDTRSTIPELNEVHKEVLTLPRKYRIPIHMHYYEGYSIKEIAEILDTKEGTVKSWLKRGREQLRTILET